MKKGLMTRLGEAIDQYRADRRAALAERTIPQQRTTPTRIVRWLLPAPGNVLFTLLVVAGLLWATNAGALPLRAPAAATTSTGTIAYQGRLADSAGNPITDTVNMIFRLYNVAAGGVPLWTEQWTGSNGVRVSDGLFNVMLGSLTPIPQSVITGHDSLSLGITMGTDDEMTPRVQLGNVPFAVQALTVLGLTGWERDESSTASPAQELQTNLLLQHGYAQHTVTSSDINTGFYDHSVTFPTPYQNDTVPTVIFTYTGESASASDVAKGGHTNGDGENVGRLFLVSNTGFTIRAEGGYVDRRDGFHWIAIGQR